MREEQNEVITRHQVAELLYMSVSTVDRLCRAGELTSIKIGRAVRFRRQDVEQFIDRNSRTCFITTAFPIRH